MNRAVVTRADSGVQEWIELTHPIMRMYAEKCNADFIVMCGPAPFTVPHHSGKPAHYYRVAKIREMLECYDRILHLDTDMIVNKDTPDIFDVVPENMVGAVREDVGTRRHGRLEQMANIQNFYGDIGWRDQYINEGTFVVSRQHRDIFLPHNNQYWTGWAGSQGHMNYNINKNKFQIFDLGYQWNHMTMFSESWNGTPSRFDSHIIHYAGGGIFEKEKFDQKIDQARSDYGKIYEDK